MCPEVLHSTVAPALWTLKAVQTPWEAPFPPSAYGRGYSVRPSHRGVPPLLPRRQLREHGRVRLVVHRHAVVASRRHSAPPAVGPAGDHGHRRRVAAAAVVGTLPRRRRAPPYAVRYNNQLPRRCRGAHSCSAIAPAAVGEGPLGRGAALSVRVKEQHLRPSVSNREARRSTHVEVAGGAVRNEHMQAGVGHREGCGTGLPNLLEAVFKQAVVKQAVVVCCSSSRRPHACMARQSSSRRCTPAERASVEDVFCIQAGS